MVGEERDLKVEDVLIKDHGLEARLPLELIIDILRRLDDSSLAKCAAVCRTWLVITRPRLFSYLLLSADRQARLSSESSNLLSHPLSTISPVVTSLTIMDSKNKDIYSTVLPLLHTLVNVRSLEIKTEGAFRRVGDFPKAIPTYHFRHITTLKLDSDFSDFSSLIEFICDFPLLETLDLEVDWAGPPSKTFSPSLRPPRSLRSLRIVTQTGFILPWFLARPDDLPPVESLDLTVANSDYPIVNQLVNSLAGSLRTLRLELWDERRPKFKLRNSFCFTSNSSLEFLQLYMFEAVVAICTVFYGLRQVRVQAASLLEDWLVDLDAILSTLPFGALPKTDTLPPMQAASSEKLFPKCYANGISCVVHDLDQVVFA